MNVSLNDFFLFLYSFWIFGFDARALRENKSPFDSSTVHKQETR